MNNLNIRDAMGTQDGDVLTIQNQWATVHITRERQDNGTWLYHLSGDGAPASTEPRIRLEEAMHVALHELAEYQRGAFR